MRSLLLLAGFAVATPGAVAAQCYMAREGSRYDFAAGGQTLFQTDFSGDGIGDFPSGLQFKSGAMEVAVWQGRNALRASAPSALVVPLAAPLPQSFTVEVGVVNRDTKQVGAETIAIYGGRSPNTGQGSARAAYGPVSWSVEGGGAAAGAQFSSDDADVCIGQEAIVRLQVNGDQLKFYADERRLASVPVARFLRAPGIVLTLGGRDDASNAVYLTHIRVTGSGTATSGGNVASAATPTSTTATTAPAPVSTATATQQPPTVTATPMQAPAGALSTTATPTTATAAPATTTATTTATPTTTTATTAQTPEALAPADRAVSTVTAPLSAPTGVVSEYLGAGYHAFAWSPVAGAEYYEVSVQHPQCAGCRVSVDPISDTAYVVEQGRLDYSGEPPAVSVRAFASGGLGASPPSTPLAVAQKRWKGYYRVTVTGFQVNRATLDDPAQIDGKWDEVFVAATSQVYDGITDQTAPVQGVMSRVHGDINAAAWKSGPQMRVKAGSASVLGGLMAGDAFPGSPPWNAIGSPSGASFPLLVWEGWLHEGRQTVTIVPTIWEADRPPSYTGIPIVDVARPAFAAFSKFANVRLRLQPQTGGVALYGTTEIAIPGVARWGRSWAVKLATNNGFLPSRSLLRGPMDPAQLRNRIQAAGSDVDDYLARNGYRAMGFDFSGLQTSATSAYEAFRSSLEASLLTLLNARDRPIGIVSGGMTSFTPVMLALDFEYAEAALSGNGPFGKGPGIVEVRYMDAMTSGMGDYTLYLRIERLQ